MAAMWGKRFNACNKSKALARIVWIKGGHLGMLQALNRFPHMAAIQAMSLFLLTWLCQACAMRRELHSRGILRRITTAWQNVRNSPWVWNASLALLAQIVTLPKVAKALVPLDRENFNDYPPLLQALSTGLQQWKTSNSPETIHVTLELCQALSAHGRLTEPLFGVFEHVLLCFMRQALQPEEWQGTNSQQQEPSRWLVTICTIVGQWAPAAVTSRKDTDVSWESIIFKVAQVVHNHNDDTTRALLHDAVQKCQDALRQAAQRRNYPWRTTW